MRDYSKILLCLDLTDDSEKIAERAKSLALKHGAELTLLRKAFGSDPQAVQAWVARCRRAAQARAEAMHARTRRDTLRQDRNLDQMMSFSGDPL